MMTKRCECRCGYRCGGPGRCSLGVLECLQQAEGHFTKDCGHDWSGPVVEGEMHGGSYSSASCAHCGMEMIWHDMRFGP